jgi:hypothetical protein
MYTSAKQDIAMRTITQALETTTIERKQQLARTHTPVLVHQAKERGDCMALDRINACKYLPSAYLSMFHSRERGAGIVPWTTRHHGYASVQKGHETDLCLDIKEGYQNRLGTFSMRCTQQPNIINFLVCRNAYNLPPNTSVSGIGGLFDFRRWRFDFASM